MISTGAHDPCMPLRVHAQDGARLVACAHGGQVLGWTPAGSDRDRLWLSPLARCGPGEAVRGGVPVVFPQFATRGPLPKHGIARDRCWDLDTGSEGAPVARIAAELRDDEQTRAIWPHSFCLSLLAEAVGNTLTLTVQVRNEAPEGGEPFSLTAALHTYLAANVATAQLSGLAEAPLATPGPLDVAFRGARGPVRLADGHGSELEVTCEGPDGFDSLVVWNPGRDHELADVPPGGSEKFVCVEPARLDPVTVEPQGTWRAAARLTALASNIR